MFKTITLSGLFLFILFTTAEAQNKLYELDSIKYGPGKVFYRTDTPAEFPGGNERLVEFFKTTFDASVATDISGNQTEGAVAALFIVEPNGRVRYVEITKHYTSAYDEEMTSTLMAMPKWKPATIEGKPVRSFVRYGWELNFFMK